VLCAEIVRIVDVADRVRILALAGLAHRQNSPSNPSTEASPSR
jgi:hypothetical protein